MKKSILKNTENEFELIWDKYNTLLRKVFAKEINILTSKNNIDGLNNLIAVLNDYDFKDEIELIKQIIEKYNLKVQDLENKIKTELTLENKDNFLTEISSLKENDKETLTKQLENFENKLLSLIAEIKEQEELLGRIGIEINKVEYKKLKNKELKAIIEQNKKIILSKKKDILNKKRLKLEAVIKEILDLETLGVFESDELWDVIKSSTTKKNKVKKK